MEGTVLLLPHQERFLQTPNNFPDIRWHFLLAGYGAGKTRSLAIAALKIIAELDGEKDDGGLYAKIAIAGYTYAHLEQTFMIDFKAYLDASKTPYHEDTKDHIITVGTVQVMFLQLSEPGKIFGQSIYCALCLDGTLSTILTKLPSGGILYKKLKDISVGDTVLTRYGWRKVIRHISQGKKKIISRRGFVGTPDHSVAAVGGYTELQDLHGQGIYSLSKKAVRLWENTNQAIVGLERLLSLTEESITDTLCQNSQSQGIISTVMTVKRYISLYGKKRMGLSRQDVKYITRTATLLITLLKILSASQKKNTAEGIMSLAAGLKLGSARKALQSLRVIYAEKLLKDIVSEACTVPVRNSVLPKHGKLLHDTLGLLSTIKGAKSAKYVMTKDFVNTVANLLRLFDGMVDFAANSAETLGLGKMDLPQSKRKNTEPLPVPFVAERFRLKERILDFAHALVSTMSGGTREVYDITVEDCHEFLTSCGWAKNCDEIDELEEDTMIEAMKSVSQRVRQIMPNHRPPYIMAASTAQGMKGFYRLYSHYKKNGVGFVLTRARTQDNWYLPKDYIEDLWKNFTETERKVYMEGEFLTVTQGRVIPGFDWDKNYDSNDDIDLELAPGERVYIGMDFNQSYNRASAWISRDGCFHCIKYYDFPDPAESAKVFRYDFPYQEIFWLPDVTSKDLYPQYARELRKYGVHIIHRTKSPLVEDSCFLLSKMCLQGRLIIHSQAVEVADAFATASRDKNNKIPKGVGPSSPIHAIDGARYACSYMALVLPEYRDVRDGLMQHLASFRRSLEEPEGTVPVQYRGAGYTQLEGEAFL